MHWIYLAFSMQSNQSSMRSHATKLTVSLHTLASFKKIPLKVCKLVWATAKMVINEIILNDRYNYHKLPQIVKQTCQDSQTAMHSLAIAKVPLCFSSHEAIYDDQ